MATISVRVDDTLKGQAERVLSDIGLPLSSAISVYLREIVRKNAVPFELRASDSVNSFENQNYIANMLEDYNDDKKNFHEHELLEA